MVVNIFIPADTTACALGADEVATEIAAQAAVRGLEINIVRNGSRGAFWLEPLVEVESDSGRQAFGPVEVGPFGFKHLDVLHTITAGKV